MAFVQPLADIFSAKCMQSTSCNLAIKLSCEDIDRRNKGLWQKAL